MYNAMVKVTFKEKLAEKDENGKPKFKKYRAKKECTFFENSEEALKLLGETGLVEMLNAQKKAVFARELSAKLKARVLGEAEDTGDIEDLSDDIE